MSEVLPVLRCENLSKTFREGEGELCVLESISFSVAAKEHLAIVGASGSGKSTLLHLLGGLENPSTGQVFWQDKNISSMREAAKSRLRNEMLGFVYQFHHLLPEFDALENVCMPLYLQGVSDKKAKERASAIIERVGLANRMTHRVGELSGGERQRIAIARALVTNPKCVLADEPTGNLDQKNAEQVFALMSELSQDLQTSFIIVTHNNDMAKQMDRVLQITQGKLA